VKKEGHLPYHVTVSPQSGSPQNSLVLAFRNNYHLLLKERAKILYICDCLKVAFSFDFLDNSIAIFLLIKKSLVCSKNLLRLVDQKELKGMQEFQAFKETTEFQNFRFLLQKEVDHIDRCY